MFLKIKKKNGEKEKMKVKTTKKEIKKIYNNIIEVSYCNLQNLLINQHPSYFTSGVYGWNSDIYIINNVAICTGYRPFGNVKPDYKTIEKYNQKAKDIYNKEDYKTAIKKINKLLIRFIDEVLKTK